MWYIVIRPCAAGEKPLCYIPTHEIQAVERVDEEAFGMKFVSYRLQQLILWYNDCIDDTDSAGRW